MNPAMRRVLRAYGGATQGPWRARRDSENGVAGIHVDAPSATIVGKDGFERPRRILESGVYPEKSADAEAVCLTPLVGHLLCDLVETLFPEKSTATSENPNETLERTKRIVGDFFENAALDLRAGARTIGMRAPEADGVVLLRPVAGRGVGCAFNDRSENKRPFSEPIPSPL